MRTLEQDELNHDRTGVETDAGTKPVDPTEKLNELSAPAARDGSWKPRVFVCYSQKDDASRRKLETHLKILRRLEVILVECRLDVDASRRAWQAGLPIGMPASKAVRNHSPRRNGGGAEIVKQPHWRPITFGTWKCRVPWSGMARARRWR